MPKNYHLYLRGSVGGWNFDSEYTSYILDKNQDKEVNVLIDSLGGRVNTAFSINSLFKAHGNVHAHFTGMNASAATIAAMGAKHVSIDANCPFLVHKCLNLVLEWDYMNADELQKLIDKLQKMKDDQDVLDQCIAGIYASRCKKPKADLLALMEKGGWITAKQALEWGFVDEITDYEEDEKPVLTNDIASALCSAGIPLPPIPSDKKDSFFDKLRRFFVGDSNQTSTDVSDITDAPDNGIQTTENSDNSQNSLPMKKFAMLATLFGDAIALTDSKAELTEAQLDKIEESLSAKDTEIATLKAQIAEKDKSISDLNATVADLKKAPAEDTKDVKETSASMDTDGPGDDFDSVAAELAKAFMA